MRHGKVPFGFATANITRTATKKNASSIRKNTPNGTQKDNQNAEGEI
jgi:hypothetical protein